MALKTIEAFITKIGEDHIIALPAEMPVGATVIVTVVPDHQIEEVEAERRARFAATLEAIHKASAHQEFQPKLAEQELDDLIERARKSKQ